MGCQRPFELRSPPSDSPLAPPFSSSSSLCRACCFSTPRPVVIASRRLGAPLQAVLLHGKCRVPPCSNAFPLLLPVMAVTALRSHRNCRLCAQSSLQPHPSWRPELRVL